MGSKRGEVREGHPDGLQASLGRADQAIGNARGRRQQRECLGRFG